MLYGAATPTKLLEKLSPLYDYDFILAHDVLNDKTYADYYLNRTADRTAIMDNGFHELGASLGVADLLEAYKRSRPSYVIAPDKLGDAKFTLENAQRVWKQIGRDHTAVVLQGRDSVERASFFSNVRSNVGMICFPFRSERYEHFQELWYSVPSYLAWPRIHLLGMSTLAEAFLWKNAGLPNSKLSFDTTKPLKWGFEGKLLENLTNLRGGGGWPRDQFLLDEQATEQTLPTVIRNIAYLRRFV